jgi:hypothetical protein
MVFLRDYTVGLLSIEDCVAQRSGNRVEVYWGRIWCPALNMKSVVQTIAEAVVGIKYNFILCKV